MEARAAAYLVREYREGTQYWITVPIGDGWLAAFRVTYHGEGSHRRARIGELRIVPGQSGSAHTFEPRRNSALYEADALAAGRSIPPFPFEALRRGITPRFFNDVLASIGALLRRTDAAYEAEGLAPKEWGEPASQVEPSSPKRRVGRPPERPLSFYATLAVRYHAIEHGTRKEPGASTRALLARQYKKPVTTIGKWIRIARQHKFLTPVRSGQRGGMATTAARELARGQK